MTAETYSETLHRVMTGSFDDATPEARTQAVREVIQVCSIASAAVCIQPIPVLDSVLITPIQIAMVQAIGRIRGHRLDTRSVVEILSTFGASLVSQNVVLAAAKLIPFAGWALGISMGYALTWAVGEVSDHYFRTGRGTSSAELRAMFEERYQAKKKEKQATASKNGSLRERLEQLTAAFEAGLISQEEFARKKEELLRSF